MEEISTKLITVLMSVYNERKDFLERSIKSILYQSYENFEFLIVDDGSTQKECLEILAEYSAKDSRIKIIRNEKNLGLAKSLNIGLRRARGKYIARLDSDDISDILRLEKQINFMEKNPQCALCGSWAYIIDENTDIIGQKKFNTNYENIKKRILYFNFFTHSSFFFRQAVIMAHGGYSENIKKAQDYDLILKISARHAVANIPEFLCFNRTWSESITSQTKKKQEWYAMIARLRAIWFYGYPKLHFFKIIPSFFYFLFVPYFLEKKIFKFIWRQ